MSFNFAPMDRASTAEENKVISLMVNRVHPELLEYTPSGDFVATTLSGSLLDSEENCSKQLGRLSCFWNRVAFVRDGFCWK